MALLERFYDPDSGVVKVLWKVFSIPFTGSLGELAVYTSDKVVWPCAIWKVNDVDIKTFAVKSLRRRIGYVGQEPVLFATSVKETSNKKQFCTLAPASGHENILQGSIGATQDDIDRVVEDAELSFVQAEVGGSDYQESNYYLYCGLRK
eukprot:485536-Amphidinium_carterae.1